METIKIFLLVGISILSLSCSLSFVKLFLRKARLKSENDGNTNISYSLLLIFWVLSISLVSSKSLLILNEFMDIGFKINISDLYFVMFKTSVLFLGISVFWIFGLYFISSGLLVMILGKKDLLKEIENNNYNYILIKGFLFVSFVYSLLSIFDLILRFFLPSLDIPFYR